MTRIQGAKTLNWSVFFNITDAVNENEKLKSFWHTWSNIDCRHYKNMLQILSIDMFTWLKHVELYVLGSLDYLQTSK